MTAAKALINSGMYDAMVHNSLYGDSLYAPVREEMLEEEKRKKKKKKKTQNDNMLVDSKAPSDSEEDSSSDSWGGSGDDKDIRETAAPSGTNTKQKGGNPSNPKDAQHHWNYNQATLRLDTDSMPAL